MAERNLSALSAAQDGLSARWQARDHLTTDQLRRRMKTGRLEVVRRSVYRSAGAPSTARVELRAALLASGPDALASHRSAAELWRMPGIVAEAPEILVPWPQWPRLRGVRTHSSRRIPGAHRAERDGFAVTSPARTIADLAGVLPRKGILGPVVDDALRRHLTTLPGIEEVLDLLAGRGRRGLSVLREVLAERGPDYQPGDSQGERRLSEALVAAGLPRPHVQHQVGVGPTVYLLDLAYPELRLGIEYDDWHTHGSRTAFDRDRTRGNRLAAEGWTLLHVTSGMPEGQAVAGVRAAFERLIREEGSLWPNGAE